MLKVAVFHADGLRAKLMMKVEIDPSCRKCFQTRNSFWHYL